MRLYGGTHSGYTQKVRVALAEKGLTDIVPFVDAPKAERGPLHARARNVLRLVPVLDLDDGTFLNESSAIIEYLDARYPARPLIPTDPLRRARMHALDHYQDQALTPLYRRLWGALVEPGGGDVETIAAARTAFIEVFRHLDVVLEGPYLVGDFSLADVAFVPRLQLLPMLGVEVPAELARVSAWIARLRARPSWAETMFPPVGEPSPSRLRH
jgi:glutathione S-transferase